MSIIDTHTHIHIDAFDNDRDAVVEHARAQGVERILTLGTDLASSKKALSLTEAYDGVYSAAGIHPCDAHEAKPGDVDAIRDLAAENVRILAIGEIGLDFYWETRHFEAQYQVLREMLAVAKALDLPVVIHTRNAQRELQWFFQEENITDLKGVMHCFEGDRDDARFYLDMGLHISFTANITYKNSPAVRAVSYVPVDRIIAETDSPYIAPAGERNKRNEPANVRLVVEKMAELRQVSVDEMIALTTVNAERLFRFPPISPNKIP